ncbi:MULTISPECIES: spore germination protein GerW family protein [Cellulomonas]|uniref:Putative spore protein YtfJ n=1 Tax=Cellulomonas oligotrophica TaxID=931536 RepID=A0A7Y9FC18_9CELL|nr:MULTISPECIES: spore germination protein GerW family protein [Cellulomonas]NYD84475.1 putative spore protein YtfJ [Cellulomonas oligotrophica]TQL04422.1 sporulation protein YtfJ [Cellulomonas sp. SLBN-39]GIG33883.1 hypothetical protein Col01nite_30420 [Cellulomonas oligotrophica]
MTEHSFDVAALTRAAQDTLTVRRVFGEAYERDGTLVVPVARVTGALGAGAGAGDGAVGGGGPSPQGSGDAGGGGWGTQVKPLGVFVVDADGAHWRPALDLNRVILGGQLVGAVAATAWALAWALRRRR